MKLLALRIGKNYTEVMPNDVNFFRIPREGDGALRISLNDITKNNNKLRLCGDNHWREGYYYAHPKKENCFIPDKIFERFIIEEQFGDIVNYISENMSVKYLKFSLLKSDEKSLSGKVGYKGVSAETDISKIINKNFSYSIGGISKTNKRETHYWIDEFPMLKSAVKNGASTFQSVINVNSSFEIGGRIILLGMGEFGSKYKNIKQTQYYIEYSK